MRYRTVQMRFLTTSLVLMAALATSAADKRPLTLEILFGEDALELSGAPQSGFEWIDDTHFLWPETDADGELLAIVRVHADSEEQTTLVDVGSLVKELDEESRKALRKRSNWIMSPDGNNFLVLLNDDIWLVEAESETLEPLTQTDVKEETASFSPDDRLVAFTREHDLWVLDLEDRSEQRLTTDGSETIHNGILDWVYQEEIYGRGNFHGYWWSEDSASIAFLRLDESPVDTFLIVDQVPYLQTVETMRYPKAGSANPIVSLHVVEATGGEIRPVELGEHDEDILIVNVSWSLDHEVLFQVQNRTQTWLELRRSGREGGSSKVLLKETSPAWVDDHGAPHFLDDGSWLWQSERDGWRHIYHYSRDGKLLRQVTHGEWEVRALHGVDDGGKRVYFSGTKRSPIGLDLYRVGLNGSDLQQLSMTRGWHDATFSSNAKRYLDIWSNLEMPPRVTLHDATGETIRVIDHNRVEQLEQIVLLPVKFVTIPDGDGFAMESMLIEPAGADERSRRPVYQFIYGGPHAQQVVDRWRSIDRYLFHQFLAQNGIGVWVLDNRTASGKGAVSTRQVFRRFGETEMEDVNTTIGWLKSQPWVDPDRIMISGWSYGGFMTLYAMTHSEHYVGGIAGGSVTDWRDYDTIYTERYMGLPSENEDAYRKSSPRFAAENLHGDLLLIHGTIDDNVHMQNTMQMAHELQNAGKPFQMMLYPKSRHGITDEKLKKHLYETMWRFIQQTLH